MKNEVKKSFFKALLFMILAVLSCLVPLQAEAAINPQINFQGKITNPDGTNITNGSYSIRFRLYTDPTLDAANACGANSCQWEESKNVTVNSGIFQTALGDITALPGNVDFNSANIHLGIKVGADAEMTPRVRFTASPYAFNAEKVGGLGVQQLVQLSPGSQQTGALNLSGGITAGGTLNVTGAVTLGALGTGVVQSDASGVLSSGTLTVSNGGTGATSFNTNGVVYGSGTTLASTTAGTTGQCLIAATGSAPTWGACGGGGGTVNNLQDAYVGTTTGTPEFTLDSTRGGISVRDNASAISGNLFEVQNNAGTLTYLGISAAGISVQNNNGSAFAFDSTTNTMKVYENVATPTNFASISYASGAATFAASSGTTQIGNGSGNVTANLTGGAEYYRFNKTFTPSGAYSLNDFSVQRSLTGAANALGGSVVKIEDLSTGTASAPNVLSINQNNSGATGNLIVATVGGSTTRFSVNTAGNGYFAGSLRVAGLVSCASVQTDATGAFSCGAGASASTLQQAYTASGSANPQILLSATGGGLKIQDAATSVGGNLFSVANNGGTINYFAVTTSRINIGVADTNGTLLVLDTDTDATEPTGVNGAMYYNSSLGKFRCHEAGAWVNCISSGSGSLSTRSFVDSTADGVIDGNTTEYWDLATENNNSRPNIILSATGKSIWGIATVETISTGTQDTEVTVRIERGIGAPPTCGSGTAVGGKAGTFASNTNATKTSTTQFIDDPGTTSQVFYTVCSDLDTTGTTANISRIRVTLFELDNSNL